MAGYLYTPSHIEKHKDEVTLTARQKLAHVRKALELIRDAKAYWPYNPAVASAVDALAKEEEVFADDIRRTDAAIYDKTSLCPEFINIDNDHYTLKCLVYMPNDKLDMPHISVDTWEWMKGTLGSDNIEVNADYDVYVANPRCGYIYHIIPRFE